MNWYVASLLLHGLGTMNIPARRCYFLIRADDHSTALNKCLAIGARQSKEDLKFGGIIDLLLVDDSLGDGAEILWSQTELLPSELREHIRAKQQMRAFREKQSGRPTNWYVGSVVLREVHDKGSHGTRVLVWINSYLIEAADPEAAYQRSVQIGEGEQDEPVSHKCDGEDAHWEFEGIEDVIPVRESPADGALLWCDHFQATAQQLSLMVPDKSQLGVFRWEAEQNVRWPSG